MRGKKIERAFNLMRLFRWLEVLQYYRILHHQPPPPPPLDPKQFPDATFCADFFRQEIRRRKRFSFDGSCNKAPEVFVRSLRLGVFLTPRRLWSDQGCGAAAISAHDFSTQMAFYARVGTQPSAQSARLLTEGHGLPSRHTWICDWGGFTLVSPLGLLSNLVK